MTGEKKTQDDADASKPTSAADKLKATRARLAGWLTRTLNQYDSTSDAPSVLEALKDRISKHLQKLQKSHDDYIEALDDDDIAEEAEQWMESYFHKATKCLSEIETRLRTPKVKAGTGNEDDDKPLVSDVTAQESPSIDTDQQEDKGASALSTDDLDRSPDPRLSRRQTSVDAWIDELEVGKETSAATPTETDLAQLLIQLQGERDLPKVELPTFDGSPLMWPRFAEQFFVQVHSRVGLNDSRRMDLLQSHVCGDAKRLIQGLGYSGHNYVLSLKELKFAFGHRIAVARAFTQEITTGNVLPSGDSTSLMKFYVSVRDCITTLHQMNYTNEIHSGDLLHRTCNRIPNDKRTKWNDFIRNVSRNREPTLMDLEKWLKDCVESDINPYAIAERSSKRSQVSSPSLSSSHRTMNTVSNNSSSLKSCPLCTADHHVSKCKEYMDRDPEGRYELAKGKQLCFNCLSPRHRVSECKSTTVCKVTGCSSKHHTSLHRKRQGNTFQGQVHSLQGRSTRVFFQVLPVVAQGRNGRCIDTFAILDSASDVTIIDSALAKDLGLRGRTENLSMNTLSSSVTVPSQRVRLSVREPGNPDALPIWIEEAWTRPGSFKCAPIRATEVHDLPHLRGLALSDVKAGDVKLLIGANVPRAHLQITCRQGENNAPIAVQTHLGWCLFGPSSIEPVSDHRANVNFITTEDDLNQQVERFWKTESFGVAVSLDKPTSIEDRRAMLRLQKETKLVNGQFEVPMLWRDVESDMPDNRPMAERRFASLHKKLSLCPELKTKYVGVMNSYISSGHARKLTAEQTAAVKRKTWYLPHHGVTNPNKPGKLRVVFDAAAEYHGVSLNNQLMTGPDLLNNLFTVIQLFRFEPVALVADIAEMFHRVRVPESDADSLRFLWKEDPDAPGPPDTYVMQVHIFGATDSPCAVSYALRQAAEAAGTSDSRSKDTILNNFYVDDMLKSVENTAAGVELAGSISRLLSKHGFKLTKWMSSCREVLLSIPKDIRAEPQLDLDLDSLPVQRALGIRWNVETDSFVFNPVIQEATATKRCIVSTVSSIFDPCGFLAPFLFRAKCIIQDIWRASLAWDDLIPSDLQRRWHSWQDEVQHLSSLGIPRFHGPHPASKEVHIFCDASELGFAAVAYLRLEQKDGSLACSFLAAKTHVVPIKQGLTIPKMELQGAVMAVRLCNTLKNGFSVDQCIFWTDALTVLRYIQNDDKRWKIFVANRVAEIRQHTDPDQWKFVPSTQNPADSATRGLHADEITTHSTWLRGPDFLWHDVIQWPTQPEISPPDPSDENLRKSVFNIIAEEKSPQPQPISYIFNVIAPSDFSSWIRLLRHTAWFLRAIGIFRLTCKDPKLPTVRQKYLSCSELKAAEIALVRSAQEDCFKKEVDRLKGHELVNEGSSLLPLDPFYDNQCNAIRVGGRVRKAPVEAEFKHQLLLPYDHHVTNLIALDVHQKLAHSGIEHTVSAIRQRFWPLKCRQMVKKVISRCFECLRRSAQPKVPMMADLPAQRVSGYSRPFQSVGVDYFGPMMVKRARARVKKWGCLFTCLVTRAIHLELADSLQTDDFIMVLRCFISRRGQPDELFSDNGTNFKGADRELRRSLEELDQQRISNFLSHDFIQWNFIPPHAPHFGGAWERLVGSVKRTLKVVLKDQCVAESVLRTTLTEIEGVINSRPLTYNSSDTKDFSALTPNHFLHGYATAINPPGHFDPSEINSRKRWRQCQVLADHIWQRFVKEYLPSLTVRNKWNKDQPNLAANDLVMLVDDNAPRGQWLLGRVLQTFPSEDGRVRSVKVQTRNGIYLRPSAKICFLEEGLK